MKTPLVRAAAAALAPALPVGALLCVPLAGWRLGGEVQYVGERYNNAANTQRLPGYTLLNLTAERPLGRDWRLLARIDNATDRAYESVLGYATAGRTVFVGLTWAPR